jgi:hypothetical protein
MKLGEKSVNSGVFVIELETIASHLCMISCCEDGTRMTSVRKESTKKIFECKRMK